MARSSNKMDIYLEIGQKKTFAGALEWPGWSRSGRDEAAALQALLAYGPRYEHVLQGTRLGFQAPADVSAFKVSERLEGNTTTDFGAPGLAPAYDAGPVDEEELRRFQAVLEACWQGFDAAVKAALGQELRKGPRGGGRELEGIVRHVLDADTGYLAQLGWKFKRGEADGLDEEVGRTRQAILEGLAASGRGEIPATGPRGGARWTPRYFVRRVAWHVLDHTWEIENRVT